MKSKLNFLAKVMVITLSWQLFVFCLAGMLGGSDILYYIHNYHPLKEILGYCFEKRTALKPVFLIKVRSSFTLL